MPQPLEHIIFTDPVSPSEISSSRPFNGPNQTNECSVIVANEGFVLYIGGDYSLCLKCWVTCTICQQTSCHVNTWDDNVKLDMRTRIRPADWCAAVRSLSMYGKPVRRIWQLARSSHQGRTYSRMLRVNHGFMWNVKCDVLRCMSQTKGLVNINVYVMPT